MRFSIKDRKPCCRGKFWSFFDPRKSRNRDRNFLGSRSGGLGCATTDRIFFLVRYIHGAAADRAGSFWEASWWCCHTAKRLPRQIASFGIFLENGRNILENGLWSKIPSTNFLLWPQRSQKWFYFLLEPFLHSEKTKKPSSTILRHLNFLGKQCNGRWQSRGPIKFSWKVLISMESKLDRIFGPKAIEWLFAEIQQFYEHS